MSHEFDPYYKWLGIPPSAQPADHYRLLGVQIFEDNADVISNAADQRMAHIRTFQTSVHSKASQQILRELATARLCLLDARSKSSYDTELKASKAPFAKAVPAARQKASAPAAGMTAPLIETQPKAGPNAVLIAAIGAGCLVLIAAIGIVVWLASRSDEPALPNLALADSAPTGKSMPSSQEDGVVAQAVPQDDESQANSTGIESNVVPNPTPPIDAPAEPPEKPAVSIETPDGDEQQPIVPIASDTPQPSATDVASFESWVGVDEKGTRTVYKKEGDRWVESKDDRLWSKFDEMNRTAQHVELYNDSRKIYVRLGMNDAAWSRDRVNWHRFGRGAPLPLDDSIAKTDEPPPSDTSVDLSPEIVRAKSPVPTAAQLEAAKKEIDDVFGDLVQKAKTAPQKLDLAKKLLDTADQTKRELATRYVLLTEAVDVAADIGSIAIIVKATQMLDDSFENSSALDIKRNALQRASKASLSAEKRAELSKVLLVCIDELAVAGQLDEAIDTAGTAITFARRAGNYELVREIVARRKQLESRQQQYALVKKAEETLTDKPDDPRANALIGRYRCLVEGDWDVGLPHLARGNDTPMAEAAKLELNDPQDLKEQAAVADIWYELSKKADDAFRPQMQARSLMWYTEALGQASGLEQLRIGKRLEELQIALKDTSLPRTASNRSSRKPKKPANVGLIGRIKIDGHDVGLMLRYVPGRTLTDAKVREALGRISNTRYNNRRVTLTMVGALSLANPMNVSIRHKGGSSSGGVLHLSIDGREISAVGDDRTKDRTDTLRLNAGSHAIRWVLTGGHLGDCLIEFRGATSGTSLPVFFNPNIAVRQTRASVDLTPDPPNAAEP